MRRIAASELRLASSNTDTRRWCNRAGRVLTCPKLQDDVPMSESKHSYSMCLPLIGPLRRRTTVHELYDRSRAINPLMLREITPANHVCITKRCALSNGMLLRDILSAIKMLRMVLRYVFRSGDLRALERSHPWMRCGSLECQPLWAYLGDYHWISGVCPQVRAVAADDVWL
jgi:hypothetical protein